MIDAAPYIGSTILGGIIGCGFSVAALKMIVARARKAASDARDEAGVARGALTLVNKHLVTLSAELAAEKRLRREWLEKSIDRGIAGQKQLRIARGDAAQRGWDTRRGKQG